MKIHPSSIVSEEAIVEEGAEVGPFCIVRGKVKIGSGTRLMSHAIVGNDHGIVELGKNNVIYPHAVVGEAPQDLSYKGEETKLIIGDNNRIREGANINTGTIKGGGITSIGNNCLIMSMIHIGHDCHLGDEVVIASSCNLAGHCEIGNHVKIGGMVGITQFCRLGDHSYIAGVTAINKDVLPFTIAQGKWASMRAPNRVGMERFGYSKEEISAVAKAIRIIIKGGHTKEEAIERIKKECEAVSTVNTLIKFMEESSRGLAL